MTQLAVGAITTHNRWHQPVSRDEKWAEEEILPKAQQTQDIKYLDLYFKAEASTSLEILVKL